MRTRYLSTDFFFRKSQGEPLRRFPLPQLPVPTLAPPRPSPASLYFSSFDADCDTWRYSPETDGFPFDSALSLLLSDVVPRPCCSARLRSEHIDVSNGVNALLYFENAEVDGDEISESISSENRNGKGEGSPGGCLIKEKNKVFQFETVEVDLPLGNSETTSELCSIGVDLNVRWNKISQDTFGDETTVDIICPFELSDLLHSVDDVSTDFGTNKENYFYREDVGMTDRSKQSSELFLFEISETDLDFDNTLAVKEAFDVLLSHFHTCKRSGTDEISFDYNEFILPENIAGEYEKVSGPLQFDDGLVIKSVPFDSILEMDLINPRGNILLDKCSTTSFDEFGEDFVIKPYLVYFQEFHLLDLSPLYTFTTFENIQEKNEEIKSEKIFGAEISSIAGFYESIISSELALVDETFQSLPVPGVCVYKETTSSRIIMGAVLSYLHPHSMSVCDSIYLDWHPSIESTCNFEICCAYIDIILGVNPYRLESEILRVGKDEASFDIVFWDEDAVRSNMFIEHEVAKELLSCSKPTSLLPEAACILTQIDRRESDNGQTVPETNGKKVSSLFDSMSQNNDLCFFLNVRRGNSIKNCKDADMDKAGGTVSSPSPKDSTPNVINEVKFSQWKVDLLCVKPSDTILSLIDDIYKCYLGILQNHTDLKYTNSSPVMNDFELLVLSKDKLLELITENFLHQHPSACKDEVVWAFIALYAIRQLTYFLCFFGIQSAYLYVSNLSQSTDYLRVALKPVISVLQEACYKIGKGLLEEHPSISIIEDILRSKNHENGKILIVAEQFYWVPLNRKLSSMKISFQEVKSAGSSLHQNMAACNEFTNLVLKALVLSDCLLVAYEHVSSSFPFSEFSVIIEYGGPFCSSRISILSPNVTCLPQLLFLNVKLDDYSALKALCEGFGISYNQDLKLENCQLSHSLDRSFNRQTIVELLNFIPLEERTSFDGSFESGNKVEISRGIKPTTRGPNSEEFEITGSGTHSFPHTIMVINTHSSEKSMLISRRSSYQKILSMEKEGLQVVERDINIPLDIIFSTSVCLVWYYSGDVAKNANTIGGSASVPVFMEYIATDILMALSSAFSCCILVFEGDITFLASVMESSDALYAAAATLGLQMQLFCSYSSEATDEIVIGYIHQFSKSYMGLYPAMLESETIAEYFLMRFASINSLSAHAILSSGCTLSEFLGMSHEHRVRAVDRYYILDEAMSLFSMLCRYGELGESKSGMTECSSINSDTNCSKTKKKKFTLDSITLNLEGDNFKFPPANDDTMESSKAFRPYSAKDTHIQGDNAFSDCHESFNDSWGAKIPTMDNFCLNMQHSGRPKDFDEDTNPKCATVDENFGLFSSVFSMDPNLGTEHVNESLTAGFLGSDFTGTMVPPTAKINPDCDWRSFLTDHYRDYNDISSSAVLQKDPKLIKPKEENFRLKAAGTKDILRLNQENSNMRCSQNLLSETIKSSRSREVLPTAIEFLNKMKKKRRESEQTFEYNSCLHDHENKRKKSVFRSPSFLDSFKYQGGGTKTKKTVRSNSQNLIRGQREATKEEKKASSSLIPSWTPIDKRARQNLSFIRNGNGKQSRLIWTHVNGTSTGCSSRKRNWEET